MASISSPAESTECSNGKRGGKGGSTGGGEEGGVGSSGGIGGAFGGGIWTMKLSAFTDPDVKEAQCCKQQRARDRVDSKRQQV